MVKWFKSTIINYWLQINLFGYALRCLLLSQCPVAQEPGMRCHSTLSERGLGGASHKNLGGAVQWNTLDLVLILSRMSQYVSICDNAYQCITMTMVAPMVSECSLVLKTWSRGPNSFALLWNGTPPLLDPSLVAVLPWHREVSMSSMLLSLYII